MKDAKFNPQNLFLKTKANKYSYGNLISFAVHFRRKIQTYHIHENRPIGLYGQSSNEMIFIIASCWLLDIPFVVFNHHLTTKKTKQQIDKIQPGLLISNDTEKAKDYPTLTFDSFKLEEFLTDSQKMDDNTLSKEILAEDSSDEDIFGYFFTSGTSSSPKIVPLKRRQMISAAKSSAINILPSPNECWLLCMPLFHVGGVSIILRSLIYRSGIYYTTNFDKDEVALRLSTDTSISAVSLVPTMFKRLLENHSFVVHKNLQAVLLGGGPISNDLIKTSLKKDFPVITSYGMTETCAQIAANPLFKRPMMNAYFNQPGIFSTLI